MESVKQEEQSTSKVCGVVMPISSIDGLLEHHWLEVKSIVCSAATKAGFEPRLVSEADEVGVIQRRIINNLYQLEIVVCDVSAKNPNVMFELGMRLAFDRPTVVIKDDTTAFSFDTAPLEHLTYPRDLRYASIVEFAERLAASIKKTHAQVDPATSFLKTFGSFTLPELGSGKIQKEDYLIEEVRALKVMLRSLLQRSGELPLTSASDRRRGEERVSKFIASLSDEELGRPGILFSILEKLAITDRDLGVEDIHRLIDRHRMSRGSAVRVG